MQKLTIEFVQGEFAKRGWKLLEESYTRNVAPMRAVCPEGHETTISWNNLKAGQGCRFCAGNVKYDYEYVEKCFRDRGYELLVEDYKNNLTPLRFRCSEGHVDTIRFNDLINGHGCWQCRGKKISESLRTPDEDILNFLNDHGCQLVESFVADKKTKIKYICKCGQVAEAYYTNFQKCPNCWECGKKKSGDKCYRWNPDRDYVSLRKKYAKICGRILRRCLKATGQRKTDHTVKLLGYTAQDLQVHILNHPDFPGEPFHIDHIFPLKAFIEHGIYDMKVINALDNLRPMMGPENLVKASGYDEVEFLSWLSKRAGN